MYRRQARAQPLRLLLEVFELLLAAVALLDQPLDLGVACGHHRLVALDFLHGLAQPVHADFVLVHARAELDDDVLALRELLAERLVLLLLLHELHLLLLVRRLR